MYDPLFTRKLVIMMVIMRMVGMVSYEGDGGDNDGGWLWLVVMW